MVELQSKPLASSRDNSRNHSRLGSSETRQIITQTPKRIPMRSPKFDIRKAELGAVLNKTSLKSAWRNTVRVAMRRQYMTDPVDLMDFHSRISIECDLIEAEIMDGTYAPSKPNRVLVEKSKGLCRQVVILNVRDALVIQCLSDAFYANIKGKAPSENAFFEPERHLFTGPLNEKRTYGSFRSWLEFQRRIFNFSKERRFVIVTDITNFYDYISHAHLRNVITDYVEDVRESILDLLIFMFSELSWQPDYMPRVGIGLPQIDLDAPRLLAHCFLYELDKMLVLRKDIDYVRFMDDIDIGVDSIPSAKQILRDIDLTLHSRQVRLNSGKTKILSQEEANEHFKILENTQIGELEVEALVRKGDVAPTVIGLLTDWFNEQRFDSGNGDKILKRLLGLAIKINAPLPRTIAHDCLFRRPSVRETIYRYMSLTSPNMEALHLIFDYLESEHAIDDASYVEFANHLVDSNCRLDQQAIDRLNALINRMMKIKSESMLYSSFKIISKIGETELISRSIESTFNNWKGDYFLGRLIGSFWPIVQSTIYEQKYTAILTASRNAGAREVLRYLLQTANDRESYVSVRNIVKARNNSYPNKITHGKFVILNSILQGCALAQEEKHALRLVHQAAAKDPYYEQALRVDGD
jgi:hypothetical protein